MILLYKDQIVHLFPYTVLISFSIDVLLNFNLLPTAPKLMKDHYDIIPVQINGSSENEFSVFPRNLKHMLMTKLSLCSHRTKKIFPLLSYNNTNFINRVI